jgi:prophage antirepressor-like protein
LDEDESDVRKVYIRSENGVNQYREMQFVTESGLYALIIRSNKPAARKFRKWITAEVLPSLRKYGVYSTDAKDMDRAVRRLEDKKIKQLLTAIDGGLSATDKRLVARQCQTDEYEVWDVLSGRKRDAHMLALLYARATGNKMLNKSFYTLEGAEILLNELNRIKL